MKNFKKLFLAAVFVTAFICFLGVNAPIVKAATVAELQAQIQALLTQVAQLQAQLAQITGQPTAWCHNFNTNLRIGDSGNEVIALQTALTKDGATAWEYKGYDGVFDEMAASAVVGFQEKYASEILAPWRLTHGTGYVGSTTRAKLDKLYGCGVVPPPPEKPYIGRSDGAANGKVLLIVDNSLIPDLQEDLEIWKQDIKNEYNFETIQKEISTETPEQIKNFVKAQFDSKLAGILLIGGIPAVYFQGGWDTFPSDKYYIDFDNSCFSEIVDGGINNGEDRNPAYKSTDQEKCSDFSSIEPNFWIARLTTPSNDGNDLTLLSSYFKRNHSYRTGEKIYDHAMLAYLPILDSDFSPAEAEVARKLFLNQGSSAEKLNFYSGRVNLVLNAADYKTELTQPYEFVVYHGHGGTTFQQGITNDEVSQIRPKPLFYNMGSCFPGRFTIPSYLTGEYLFSGDALLAISTTTPVFGSSSFPGLATFLLESGFNFGSAFSTLKNSLPAHFFGDPTLKIGKQTNSVLELENIDLEKIEIPEEGYVNKYFNITFKNLGNENIRFFLRKEPDKSDIGPIGIGLGEWTFEPVSIEAGGEKTLTARLFLQPPENKTGKFEANFTIWSNAKNNIESFKVFGEVVTPAEITVLSPNGGEKWGIGGTSVIRWEATGLNAVDIKLYRGGVQTIRTIATNVDAKLGSYSWTIPSDVVIDDKYIVIISSGSYSTASDNYFSIYPISTTTCTDSDNGKNYYVKGMVNYLGILYADSCHIGQPGQSVFTNKCDGSNCLISERYCDEEGKLQTESRYCPNGCENGACKATAQPSITVLSPNGGERWEVGGTYQIKWSTSSLFSPNTAVEVFLQDTRYGSDLSNGHAFIGTTKNTGSYYWKIPTSLNFVLNSRETNVPFSNSGAIYRIIVSVGGSGGGGYHGQSGNFSIVSATTACTDSDDGKNYYVKGTVNWSSATATSNPSDQCVSAIINGVLKQNVLREYFCTADKQVDYEHYECLNGCENGVCKQSGAGLQNIESQLANISATISNLAQRIRELIGR